MFLYVVPALEDAEDAVVLAGLDRLFKFKYH